MAKSKSISVKESEVGLKRLLRQQPISLKESCPDVIGSQRQWAFID